MKPVKKAWMTAMTKGSKALQARLSKIHADNPEFQAFVKKHGLGDNLSVKQSDKYKKQVPAAAPAQEIKPEVKLSTKEREDLIRNAAEKAKHRRLASANRAAFGGELGGGYIMPRSGFRRYSEEVVSEAKKKIVLGKRIPQLPGTVDHPVPKGYVRVKDSQGFNVLKKKIKESTTMSKKNDLPFDPDPPKKNPGVTVGKNLAGYSRARWLARMAMNKQDQKITKPQNVINIPEATKSLQELKKSTLASYINKAAPRIRSGTSIARSFDSNIGRALRLANKHHPKVWYPDDPEGKNKDPKVLARAEKELSMNKELQQTFSRGAANRIKGVQRAAKKLAKEEVVQEVSNTSLVSYVSRAIADRKGQQSKADAARRVWGHDPERRDYHIAKADVRAGKRSKGIKKALSKIASRFPGEPVTEGKNPYGSGFRLVHSKTGKVYKVGDKTSDDRDADTILGWQHGSQRGNSASSGRVRVRVTGGKDAESYEQEYFPHVYGMKVVKEENVNESSAHRLDATYKSAFVHGHNRKEDGRAARVYRSARTGNWITKHYENDTKVNQYETDGYEDAHNSAKKWVGSVRSIKYKGEKSRLDESNIMNASKKLFRSKIKVDE